MKIIAITCVLLLCTSCRGNVAPVVTNATPTNPASTATTAPTSPVTTPALTKWTAISSTAMGVTGDIEESPNMLVISGHRFAMTPVRPFTGVDLTNAASILDMKPPVNAKAALSKILIPSTTQLNNSNTACGKEDVTWIVTMQDEAKPADLWLAMFSGATEPDLTPAVVNNATYLCGTYWYQQPQK